MSTYLCSEIKDSYQIVWQNLIEMFDCRGYDTSSLEKVIKPKNVDTLTKINLLCSNMKNGFYAYFVSVCCERMIQTLKQKYGHMNKPLEFEESDESRNVNVNVLHEFCRDKIINSLVSDMDGKMMEYFLKCFLDQELVDQINNQHKCKTILDLVLLGLEYSKDGMVKSLDKTGFWYFMDALCVVKDQNDEPVYVFVETCNSKPKKEYVSMCVEYCKSRQSSHCVIIYYCEISNTIFLERDLKMRENESFEIELFESHFFYSNISRHFMQSSQKILRGTQKEKYLSHFKQKKIMTKMIKQSDAICKYYNAKPGDLVVYYDCDFMNPISVRQCVSG